MSFKIFSYAGDCDISFYLKGLSGGIKDFQVGTVISKICNYFDIEKLTIVLFAIRVRYAPFISYFYREILTNNICF